MKKRGTNERFVVDLPANIGDKVRVRGVCIPYIWDNIGGPTRLYISHNNVVQIPPGKYSRELLLAEINKQSDCGVYCDIEKEGTAIFKSNEPFTLNTNGGMSSYVFGISDKLYSTCLHVATIVVPHGVNSSYSSCLYIGSNYIPLTPGWHDVNSIAYLLNLRGCNVVVVGNELNIYNYESFSISTNDANLSIFNVCSNEIHVIHTDRIPETISVNDCVEFETSDTVCTLPSGYYTGDSLAKKIADELGCRVQFFPQDNTLAIHTSKIIISNELTSRVLGLSVGENDATGGAIRTRPICIARDYEILICSDITNNGIVSADGSSADIISRITYGNKPHNSIIDHREMSQWFNIPHDKTEAYFSLKLPSTSSLYLHGYEWSIELEFGNFEK